MMETSGNQSDWALRLFRKSLLKQAKWKALRSLLEGLEIETGLDVGADNGVISLLLRERGGTWHSVDTSDKAVSAIRSLVGERVERIDGRALPFEEGAFDIVVIVDLLEHLDEDQAFVRECHRVLKQGGTLVVNVPHVKSWSLVRPLRRALGVGDRQHGHVRPGYSQSDLFRLLKDGFDVQVTRTYSRFFVFVDGGYVRSRTRGADDDVNTTHTWAAGWGAGLRANTAAGLLGIDFGWGRKDSFGEGKIHVRLETAF